MNTNTKNATKWDFGKKEYQETKIPNGSSVYEYDTKKIITCASCEKPITYGESYPSKAIYDDMGFAYAVCSDCMEKEWRELIKN